MTRLSVCRVAALAVTGCTASAPDQRPRIALVMKSLANEFFKTMEDGARAHQSPDGHHHWPAFSVNVVDTTAAGDAFNAAYAVAMAEGQDDVAAGRFACAAGACSVTREGAQAAMPDRAEVER